MSSEPVPEAAGEARATADLRSVPGWRRTGLVLGWLAVACGVAALLTWLTGRDELRPAVGVLVVVAAISALLAPVWLRRAWSVPPVADDPAVVRARGWSDVAIVAWGTAVIARFVFDVLLDVGGTWLDVVRGALGTVLLVAYVGMLVLATRWHPAPGRQL